MSRAIKCSVTVVVLSGLILVPVGPVAAECVGQPNRWPEFSEVAPTAKRIVVGTVVQSARRDPTEPTPVFTLRVDEILRGSAPESIEVRSLRSGLPLAGDRACRRDATLYANVGDVVALAYRGKTAQSGARVTTVAWLGGRPGRLNPGAERSTLADVRRLAGAGPVPTVSEHTTAPFAPWSEFVLRVIDRLTQVARGLP